MSEGDPKVQPSRGTWVAWLVKRQTSAQVMIPQFVSSSPASGSGLTAQSLESVSNSVSPSLSAPHPAYAFYLSLSLSQTYIKEEKRSTIFQLEVSPGRYYHGNYS